MERNAKAWLILAIFVMAFLADHITECVRDVPDPMKEEVYKPELLGGLLGPAWGLGVGLLPAILAAILWPVGSLGLCCGGLGPGWLGSTKDLPHHKGDAVGGYKSPYEGAPKGGDGNGAFIANRNATLQIP